MKFTQEAIVELAESASRHAKVAAGWAGSFRFDPALTEDDMDGCDEEWHDDQLVYRHDGDETAIAEGLDPHVLASLADLLNAARDWKAVTIAIAALLGEVDRLRRALQIANSPLYPEGG